MTHKQKVLRLLSDHKPHSHHELYALGCVAHSRVSDLRRDGHTIEQWREGDHYLYRLVALEEASHVSMAGGVSSSASISAGPPSDSAGQEGALVLFNTPRGAYGTED